MTTLSKANLNLVINLLPDPVLNLMQKYGDKLVLAGGFIRARIANESPKDIDLFVSSEAEAGALGEELCPGKLKIQTVRSVTITVEFAWPVQFVFCKPYANPEALITNFDFTIAQAAIWYDRNSAEWRSLCANSYERDVIKKRLIYTQVSKDFASSLSRVLRFTKQGYTMPPDEFAGLFVDAAYDLGKSDSRQSDIDKFTNKMANQDSQ